MEQKIKVKHINGLKSARAKISETGDLSHELTFDVLLDYGDLERLLIIFKQHIPVIMEISSPQSRMDLKVELITDKTPASTGPVDPTTMSELKEGNERLEKAVNDLVAGASSTSLKASSDPEDSENGDRSTEELEEGLNQEGLTLKERKTKARK